MIAKLRELLGLAPPCQHKWHESQVMEFYRNEKLIGSQRLLRCEHCGDLKRGPDLGDTP